MALVDIDVALLELQGELRCEQTEEPEGGDGLVEGGGRSTAAASAPVSAAAIQPIGAAAFMAIAPRCSSRWWRSDPRPRRAPSAGRRSRTAARPHRAEPLRWS